MRPSDSPSAIVRRRLLAAGKARGQEFYTILERFAAERFLYRLGAVSQSSTFALKGATLLPLWLGDKARPTTGVDLQDLKHQDAGIVHEAVVAACRQPAPEDALVFDSDSIVRGNQRTSTGYVSITFELPASLGPARTLLRLQVGQGDVTPPPQLTTLPSWLELPPPRVRVVAREIYLAEKFHMCMTTDVNALRMQDLHDMYLLIQHGLFDGSALVAALRSTLERRIARLPERGELPTFLEPAHSRKVIRHADWLTYRRKQKIRVPAMLTELIAALQMFFVSPLDAMGRNRPFTAKWENGLWM